MCSNDPPMIKHKNGFHGKKKTRLQQWGILEFYSSVIGIDDGNFHYKKYIIFC